MTGSGAHPASYSKGTGGGLLLGGGGGEGGWPFKLTTHI